MHSKLIVHQSVAPLILAHMKRWNGCTLCPLHSGSKQQVYFRGDAPCDVLIIGVGPLSNDEDVGKPMMGDNGDVINEIIDGTMSNFNQFLHLSQTEQIEALFKKRKDWTLKTCITNSVICRNGDAPDRDNIRACSKRLAEFIQIAKPKLLIAAGKEAGSAIISLLSHLPEYPRSMEIRGPGFVTRLSGDDRSVEIERIKLSINKVLLNVFGRKEGIVSNADDD